MHLVDETVQRPVLAGQVAEQGLLEDAVEHAVRRRGSHRGGPPLFNRTLMLGVPQIVAGAIEATKDMDADEKYEALAATAAQVMSSMPPRENPRLNKSLDSVHASGPLGRAHCVIHGNQNYKQTGLLQAYAAYSLLQQPPRRVGFASGCQAFGHRELLGVLRSFGLVSEPVLTVEG